MQGKVMTAASASPAGRRALTGGGSLISMLQHTDAQPAAFHERGFDSVRAERR